ncbi:MAG: cation:proton antiporter [Synergistaceae bacterium]|nr:cation:proton antiporter [Synergistaceae bacterium]MBR0096118.1 cation:proton antiporter [Synergistaceae bacterium]
MTRVFKLLKFKFPDVTAFLIAGVCVGPYVLGALNIPLPAFRSMRELENVAILSKIALGFIAFDIGNEFRLAQLKEMGKNATVIGVFQAVIATIFTDIALIALYYFAGEDVIPLPAAITLGAVASATAPAATLMVVRQFKAKGPVTDLLLPVVALDDAVGLVVFAISIGVAQAFNGGALNIISTIVNPSVEIIGSLILGALMGVLLTYLEKLFFSNSNRLSLTIAFVLMTIALAESNFELSLSLDNLNNFTTIKISFSSLLVCMMLGTIFCNLSEYSVDIMSRSEKWSAPLYAVFFVLSGAQLELSVFKYPAVTLIGIVYIIARCLGKYFGASWTSSLMGCDDNVKKYLGITLFPQAGVSLGMAISAQVLGPEMGGLVRNIILFSVFIYELAGPMLTKMALTRAGEIQPAESENKYRARFERKNLPKHHPHSSLLNNQSNP